MVVRSDAILLYVPQSLSLSILTPRLRQYVSTSHTVFMLASFQNCRELIE